MAIKTTYTAIPELIVHFLLPGGNMEREQAVTLVRFVDEDDGVDKIGYAPFPLKDELSMKDVYAEEFRDNENNLVMDGTYHYNVDKNVWLLERE